ncbi:MAG: UvrD-helicase domain-containing protein [Nitrospirota bacterium]
MNLSHILNESQRRAVKTIEGPVLIVAGPGTGKTLTIVYRIAYLIKQGVRPENILAVTFTNRAAKEMRERTEALLGKPCTTPLQPWLSVVRGKHSSNVFIGTFHLLGLKIIRESFSDSFIIYNRDEQIRLLKTLVRDSDFRGISQGGRSSPCALIAEKISKIKNLIEEVDDGIKRIYEQYRSALMKNSALDFDDLILKPVEIFGNSEILEKYRGIFKYIMVDEYQDINPAQYKLLMLIANSKGNLCAIGDSDQAIYAFRGADVGNFLDFEKDFKDTKTITLTQNYRSTGTILNASSILIKDNLKRLDKELNSMREKGNPITVISVSDEKAEGEIIVREIEERMGGTSHYQLMKKVIPPHPPLEKGGRGDFASDNSYRFSDFAVLFRTNAQAEAIGESFIKSGIPYQIIGGIHPLKRREIMDTLSYLKAIINPMDDLNLKRIITITLSGLSETTLSDIFRHAEKNGLSLYEAMKAYNPPQSLPDGQQAGPFTKGELRGINSKGGKGGFSKESIRKFISMLERFIDLKDRLTIDEFFGVLLEESGLREYYKYREDNFVFLENLAFTYRDVDPSEAIIRFTNEVSLLTPADAYDPRADAVALMTLHMAKGLEFKVVFIAGVEEGLIPYTIKKDNVDIEEERRLFYVAMTRAEDELFLIYARNRFLYGQRLIQSPSPFLREIPEEFVKNRFIPDKTKKYKKDGQMGLF